MNDVVYLYLVSPTGRHMFTEADWKALLQLARDYGWTPAGTVPPVGRDDLNWDRTYHPAQGQSLDPVDAERFAAALERALTDIPAQPDQPVNAPSTVSPVGVGALEYYRGSRRILLQRLIGNFRVGAVSIDAQPRPVRADAGLRHRDA